MKIAIIETGKPPVTIRSTYPGYPEMFAQLLQSGAADLEFSTFTICDGEAFPSPDKIDGVLITGSPAGVYENHSWMTPLMAFIQQAAQSDTPIAGICFGHQAVAKALGGAVNKSKKGWGVGRHTYDLVETPDWMRTDQSEFSLAVSHQDQVLDLPNGAQVVAASNFTPFAALYYPTVPALTFQGHPEFDADFSSALYNVRRNNPLPDAQVDDAIDTLKSPCDNALVAEWITAFFRAHKVIGGAGLPS